MRHLGFFARNPLVVAALSAAEIFEFAFCDSGDGVALERLPVATTLQPSDDGFTFPNFTSQATPEQFDDNDMVHVAGAEACTDGVTEPCVLAPQANAWACLGVSWLAKKLLKFQF